MARGQHKNSEKYKCNNVRRNLAQTLECQSSYELTLQKWKNLVTWQVIRPRGGLQNGGLNTNYQQKSTAYCTEKKISSEYPASPGPRVGRQCSIY